MRYSLFRDKPWAYVFQALSYVVLASGAYAWYRVHGIALGLVLVLLGGMLLAQRGFRQMTNFGLPPWAERAGLIFAFGAALWFDVLVPRIDAQANVLVAALLALCGVFVLFVAGCTVAVIITLIRRRLS